MLPRRISSSSVAHGLAIALVVLAPSVVRAEPGSPETPSSPSGAALDDLSLVKLLELKVAATKTSTSVEATPAAVTVITREEIVARQYQSVADALNHTTGFYVVDDHVLPNVGVRGMAGGLSSESGTIKVMIDGVPVTFHPTGGNWLGPELIALSAIERIEIVRGPTSSLYGADAFLAVVNIITRNGDAVRGGEVRTGGSLTSAGRFGNDVDAVAAGPAGPFEFLLSARYNYQDRSGLGLPETSPAPRLPDDVNRNMPAEALEGRSLVTFARATLHGRKHYRVRLIGRYARLDRNDEFSQWLQLSSTSRDASVTPTHISLEQGSLTLAFEWEPSPELGFVARTTGFFDGPTADDHIEVGSDLFWVKRRFSSRGLGATLEMTYRPSKDIDVVAGLEQTFDREESLTASSISKLALGGVQPGQPLPGAEPRGEPNELNNFGALVQVRYSPFTELALTGGLRFDRHSIYGAQSSGRAAAVLNPVAGLFLKLMGGTAFKAPSPALLYQNPLVAGGVIGNPELEPQRVTTVETQALYRFGNRLSASTGVSYNRLTDKAQLTLVDINQEAQNLAEVESVSWETRVDANLARGVDLYTSSERVWARQKTDEIGYRRDLLADDNPIYPEYVFRAGVMAQLPSLPLRLSAESMLVTRRNASDDNTLEAGERYSLPPYALLDVGISTVGVRFWGRRETAAALTARNVLDAEAADPGFAGVDYPLQARTIYLQLRQEL
jgi:outer membrane receptor for ferrienterochelin and colicins